MTDGGGIRWWALDRHGPVAVLTYRRPPRNFMSFAAIGELEALLRAVGDDPDVRVVVLTGGVPGYFVAHADLEDLGRLGRGEPVEGDPRSWHRALGLVETIPQPVVAALNGQAWGGGSELALACTLRLAAESASLAQPEVNIALIPGAGGTQRLPRLIGPGRAAEVVLSGRVVTAREALGWGWVNAVLPDDRFLEHVLDWVRTIAGRPPQAVQAAKRAMVEGLRLPLADALRVEGRLFAEQAGTPEALARGSAAVERYRTTAADVAMELW